MMIVGVCVEHQAMQEISLRVCGVTAGLTCAHWLLNVTTGVQPHPAPESNQSDLGQMRLLKPAIIHTHSHNNLYL